jgi:hypothetical protein
MKLNKTKVKPHKTIIKLNYSSVTLCNSIIDLTGGIVKIDKTSFKPIHA